MDVRRKDRDGGVQWRWTVDMEGQRQEMEAYLSELLDKHKTIDVGNRQFEVQRREMELNKREGSPSELQNIMYFIIVLQ